MKAAETRPHVIMIRAIQIFAPMRCMMTLLGKFEDEVADEEQARAESEDGLAKVEIDVHLQLGEADVDAIEIRDDVADHQERNDPT